MMNSASLVSPASPTRVRFAIDNNNDPQQQQDTSVAGSPSPSFHPNNNNNIVSSSPASCVKIAIAASPSPTTTTTKLEKNDKDNEEEQQNDHHPLFANLDQQQNENYDDEDEASPLPVRVLPHSSSSPVINNNNNNNKKPYHITISPSLGGGMTATNQNQNNNTISSSIFIKDRLDLNPKLEEAWNLLFWALQDNDTGLVTESSIHSHLAMILPVINWDLPNTDYDCLFIHDPHEYQSKQQEIFLKRMNLHHHHEEKVEEERNIITNAATTASSSSSAMRNRKNKEDGVEVSSSSKKKKSATTTSSANRRRIISIDDASVKPAFFRRLLRRFMPSLGHKTQIPLAVLDQGGFTDPSSVAYLDCFSGFAATAVCNRLMKVLARLLFLTKTTTTNTNSDDVDQDNKNDALEITEQMWMNMISIQNEETTTFGPYFSKSSLRNEILLSLVDTSSSSTTTNHSTTTMMQRELCASFLLEPRPFTLSSVQLFPLQQQQTTKSNNSTTSNDNNNNNNNPHQLEQDQEEAEAVRILFLVLLQNAPYLRFLLERYETPGRQLARVLIARRMNLVMSSGSTKTFDLAAEAKENQNNKNDDDDHDGSSDDDDKDDEGDSKKKTKKNKFLNQQQQQHPLYKKLADRQKQLKTISSSTMKKLIKKEKKKILSSSSNNAFLTTQNIHSSISSSLIAQEFAQELCRWTLHLWAGTRGILDTPIMQRIGERYMEAKAREFQKLAKRFKRFFVELEQQDNECDALRAGRVNDDEFHILQGRGNTMMVSSSPTFNNNNNKNMKNQTLLIDQQEILMSSLQFSKKQNKKENSMITNKVDQEQQQQEMTTINNTNNNFENEGSPRLETLLLLSTNGGTATNLIKNNDTNNNLASSASTKNVLLQESLNQIGQNPDLWLKQIENSMQPPPFSLLHHLLPEDRKAIKTAKFWATVRAFVIGFVAALLIAGGDVLASMVLFGPNASTSKKLGLGIDFSGGSSSSSSSNSVGASFLGFFGISPSSPQQQQQQNVEPTTTTTIATSTEAPTTSSSNYSSNSSSTNSTNNNNNSSSSNQDSNTKQGNDNDDDSAILIFGSSASVIYWITIIAGSIIVTCVEILYLYIDALNTCYDCAVIVGIVLRHKNELGNDVSWREVLRKQLATAGNDEEEEDDEQDENIIIDKTNAETTEAENSRFYEELVDIFIPGTTTTTTTSRRNDASAKIHENEDLQGPSPTGSPSRYFYHNQESSASSPNNGRIARVARAKLRSAVLASFRAASRVREVLSRKRSKFIDSAISRCALSLGHSSISLFGIDLNLSKHGATKRLLKSICQIIRTPLSVALVQFFLGRYMYKILLPFVSAPVCAFWNAVIVWNCITSMEDLSVASVAAERLVLEVVQKSREEILASTIPCTTNVANNMNNHNQDEATFDLNAKSYAASVSRSRARSQSYYHQVFCGGSGGINNNTNHTLTAASPTTNSIFSSSPSLLINHLLPDAVEPEFAMPHNIVQLWARALFSIGTVDAISTPSFHILTAGLLQRLGPLTPMRLHGGAATEVEDEVANKLHLTDRRLFFVSLCGALFGGHQLQNLNNHFHHHHDDDEQHLFKFKENSLLYRQKVASCVVAMQLTLLIVLEKIDEVVSGTLPTTKNKNNKTGHDDENDDEDEDFTMKSFTSLNSSSASSKYKRMLCATIACYVAPKTTFAASSASPQLSSSLTSSYDNHQSSSLSSNVHNNDTFHYSQHKYNNHNDNSTTASKILHQTNHNFDDHIHHQPSSSTSSCCWCCWCVDTSSCCDEIGEFSTDDIHAAYLHKVNARAKAISDHIATFLFGNRLEKEIMWNEIIETKKNNNNNTNKKKSNKKIETTSSTNQNTIADVAPMKSRSTTAENDDDLLEVNQEFTMIDNVAEMMKDQLMIDHEENNDAKHHHPSPSPIKQQQQQNISSSIDDQQQNKPSAVAENQEQTKSVSASPSPILNASLNNKVNNEKKQQKLLSLSGSPSLRALSANALPPQQKKSASKSKSLSKSYRKANTNSEIGFREKNDDDDDEKENIEFALKEDHRQESDDSSSSSDDEEETDSEVDEILANLPFGRNDDDEESTKKDSKKKSSRLPFGGSSSPQRETTRKSTSKSPSLGNYFNLFNGNDDVDEGSNGRSKSRSGFFGGFFASSSSKDRQDENEKSTLLEVKRSKSKSKSKSVTKNNNDTEEVLNNNNTTRANSRATSAVKTQDVTREPTPLSIVKKQQQQENDQEAIEMSEEHKQLLQDSGATRSLSVDRLQQQFQQQQVTLEYEILDEEKQQQENHNNSNTRYPREVLDQYHAALLHMNNRLLSLQSRYTEQGKLPHGNEVFDVASDLINLMSVWEYPE